MSTIRRGLGITAAAVAAVLALAGCAGSAAPGGSTPASAAEGTFPVTIEHAFGATTITAKPERVVTWGWGATDAALALGVVPVAIPAQPYGGNAAGVLPWVEEKLTALGADTPTILDSPNEVPIEAIAAADPDVFLAPYSGLTQEEYDQLTGLGIAVVAYPDKPWSTPWRDVIMTTGSALGLATEAQRLVTGIDAQIDAKAAAHPEFKGVTVAQVADSAGTFYVYLPADPRVQFTEQLGFVTDPIVPTLDTGASAFFATVGYEQLDRIRSKVLVVYAPDQASLETFIASDPAKLLPQVAAGTIAPVVGKAMVASVSPPTALSLPWGLDAYVDALAAAVAAAR